MLETLQRTAQQCLQVGWSILIPTADERARALSMLLPTNHGPGATGSTGAGSTVGGMPDPSGFIQQQQPTSGRRFMSDLLVSSLMADGGLEAAILAAIKVEVRDLEECPLEKDGERDKPTLLDEHLITEQALLEAETKRAQEVAASGSHSTASIRRSSTPTAIPLLHLIKQLLRNISTQTNQQLNEQSLPGGGAPGSSDSPNSSQSGQILPNLNLLLR